MAPEAIMVVLVCLRFQHVIIAELTIRGAGAATLPASLATIGMSAVGGLRLLRVAPG